MARANSASAPDQQLRRWGYVLRANPDVADPAFIAAAATSAVTGADFSSCFPSSSYKVSRKSASNDAVSRRSTSLTPIPLNCFGIRATSAGRAGNSNGCVTRPKGRETGLSGFAAQIQLCSLTGSYVMATAEHREPYESRGSRTVLGARGGAIPPRDSTCVTSIAGPNGDAQLYER